MVIVASIANPAEHKKLSMYYIINIVKYYEVSPTKIVRTGSDILTYQSPIDLEIGSIVRIPIGKQFGFGVVLRNTQKPSYETKNVVEVIESYPLPNQLLSLATWISKYYATPLATVWQTILPSGLGVKRRTQESPSHSPIRNRTHFLLNNDQLSAVDAIDKKPRTHLLHGVTGSGKTAVYIELARRCLERGSSAIILVPEIALTSQLVDEFTQKFPGKILLTHSQQTPAKRHTTWRSCLETKEPCIVLGPRSALFMPLANIGLIVVDECHEPSYKQDKAPRYSALRAASILSSQHKAPLVLGSATPNLIDYYLARQQKAIHSLPTPARTSNPPTINIVDATKRSHFRKHRFFSDIALQKIAETIQDGYQTLVFHNRRGSATTTLCDTCGWQAGCPTCFLPLTLHADSHHLRCHACGYTTNVPTSCPECGATDILHKGIGTKLIEHELRKLFPKARIARFDTDTEKDDSLEKRYRDVYSGDIDIIIGTQIIAKGLDLPKLRLVCVPQADAGLSLPDFAASERTFQLLSQVVGRVGRYEHPTHVIVQSYQPNHPVVQAGIHQDYDTLYHHVIKERARGHFPPFRFMLKITCTYKTESLAIKNSKDFANIVTTRFPHLEVGRPTPAFYERTSKGYRWQLLVKASRRNDLLETIKHIPTGPHWQYDIDPASLL